MVLLVSLWLCGADAGVSEKVVAFARSNLGQRVGDGECTALAVEAAQGARRRGVRGRVRGSGATS